MSRFAKYTCITLVTNFVVILWGAFVRATGSGAGCGEHWPTCNGEVIPRPEAIETMIEFTHRLTSGVALIMTVALVVWAVRLFERGHRVRKAAWTTLAFMLAEAALGAGLVLFGLVADDDSVARAVVMCMHLLNTLFLLGAMALTAWWAERPGKLSFEDGPTVGIGLGFAGLFLVGVSGAIAALGDTLFPSESLIEGFYADLDPSSHFLIRLRGYHPVFAIAVSVGLFSLAKRLRTAPHTARLATALMVLLGAQLAIGFINLGLLAPVPLQLIHLLMADIVWVVFVLLSATTLNRAAS